MSTILVTGASRGIGLEFVKQYLGKGWRVIACSRHPEQAEDLAKYQENFRDELQIYPLDVTDISGIYSLAQEIEEPIDILLNNAGIYGQNNAVFGNVNAQDWLDVFKTDTIGPFMMAQAFLQQVVESDLRIIANMSSEMGSITGNTGGGFYPYRSSKAALNAVTRSMAIDLRRLGIKAIALNPGWVKTDMGGADAPLTPERSVVKLIKVLEQVGMSDSGSFINYTSEKLAW